MLYATQPDMSQPVSPPLSLSFKHMRNPTIGMQVLKMADPSPGRPSPARTPGLNGVASDAAQARWKAEQNATVGLPEPKKPIVYATKVACQLRILTLTACKGNTQPGHCCNFDFQPPTCRTCGDSNTCGRVHKVHGSASVDTDWRLTGCMAVQEEAKDAFKELLASVGAASNATWESTMRLIVNDQRCTCKTDKKA